MKDTHKTNLNCSSKRVGMSFHKLLISDGLRVCCTGDLYKISIILLYFFSDKIEIFWWTNPLTSVCVLKGSYIYGASQQSSRIQGLPDDLEHVGRGVFQLVNFCNPTGEILKTFCGGTSRQSFITSIHSEWENSVTQRESVQKERHRLPSIVS